MNSASRNWVVFSSSSGQTFERLWKSLPEESRSRFKGLFLDRECEARSRCRKFLPESLIYSFPSTSREQFEGAYTNWALENKSQLGSSLIIFLIGYFRIISPGFLRSSPPVINTHPSLLPAFPGLDRKVHEAAYEHALTSGFSVHLVTDQLDGGPILFQEAIDTSHCSSAEELRQCVRSLEQKRLPQIVEALLNSDIESGDHLKTTRQLQRKRGFPIKCVA